MFGSFGPVIRTSLGAFVAVFLFAAVNIPSALGAPGFAPGYTAIQAGFNAQPQWQRIMTAAAIRPTAAETPWQDLITGYGSEHPLRQLDAVNRYFNRIRYGEDVNVYGVKDHWATPEEFVRRGVGDCEDYSIAKYTALRAMGWSADSLAVVAIRDHKYNVNHAVLAAKLDGQWYYLDNRASRLLKPSEVPFYQPIYAVNERQLSVFVKSQPTLEAAAREKTPSPTPAHSG
jgi:predicted transglutaminase-like cysteine proteinase